MGSDRQALAEFDAAYSRLVTEAHRAVRKFFRHDAGQVEDAVAETMARTYERWERVRRHDNPVGWVVVCAKNVCLERTRADARRMYKSVVSLDDLPIADDYTERAAISATIWNALDKLSRRQRNVAVLRYLMDYDEATTASALGTSVSRVKTAAHEARGRLRELLGDLYVEADGVPT